MYTLKMAEQDAAVERARKKLYESPLKGEEALCLDCEMLEHAPAKNLLEDIITWLIPAMESGKTVILKRVNRLSDNVQVPLAEALRQIKGFASAPISWEWRGKHAMVKPGFEVLATIEPDCPCRREITEAKVADTLASLYPHPKDCIIF